jgi:NTP pyrophosphatase (non-canonical NTP hydrolase)
MSASAAGRNTILGSDIMDIDSKPSPKRQSQIDIFREVVFERTRQDTKFGPHNRHSPERWLTILAEELGEVSRAINDYDMKQYRLELIHVAAVAMAAMECFDEMKGDGYEGRTWK